MNDAKVVGMLTERIVSDILEVLSISARCGFVLTIPQPNEDGYILAGTKESILRAAELLKTDSVEKEFEIIKDLTSEG